MANSLEETQLEVRGLLLRLTREEMSQACEHLRISTTTQDSKLELFRKITSVLDGSELSELEDQGMSILLELIDKLNEIKPPDESEPQNGVNGVGSSGQESNGSTRQQNDTTRQEQNREQQPASDGTQVRTIRRELKISGQILHPNVKDRLGFSSLTYQLDAAVSAGYSDREIVDAVVKAIRPGFFLRSYIERRAGSMTVDGLKRVLRSHHDERSPTELYQQLSSASQDAKESPQDFLIRVLDLRQKITFASEDVDSSIRYDPDLVKLMSLRTIQTGLTSDFIRSELKSELRDINISDEDLLEKLASAARQDQERKSKLKNKAKTSVVAVDSEIEVKTQQSKLPKEKYNPLTTEDTPPVVVESDDEVTLDSSTDETDEVPEGELSASWGRYPRRERRPPRLFTYPQMGQPAIQQTGVGTKCLGFRNQCVPLVAYNPYQYVLPPVGLPVPTYSVVPVY